MHRVLLLSVAALLAVPAMAADPKPIWSDEFDKAGAPDPEKWGYEVGFIRNDESQFYTEDRRENARVENGVLIIEAIKEEYANPNFDPDSRRRRNRVEKAEYTSASLTTQGKASWTTGRIEVKAKLPQGRGMWPAIWMLGDNMREVGWPACGEIDIMEYVGFEPNTIYANIHTKKYNHSIGTGRGDKITVEKPYEDFHVYAVDWTKDEMRFSVDGKEYFTAKNDGTGKDAWPFDAPEFLILNIAVGGAWGGQQGIDDSIFPQRMEIDYVRVYEIE